MRFLSLIFLAMIASIQAGYTQAVDGGHALVELVAESDAVQPGETFFAAFDMTLDEGWHVYWRNPGDAGLPPMVDEWQGSGGTSQGDFVWPIPHELVVAPGQIMDYGYADRLVLPFPVTVSEDATGLISLSGELSYLICEEICIPETAAFRLVLPVAETPKINKANGRLISDWISKSPSALDGEARLTERGDGWTLSLASSALTPPGSYLRFFPYRDEIVHSADQAVSYGGVGASLVLTPFPGEPFPEMIRGVVVAEGSSGARVGYEVEALAGAILPETSGTTVSQSAGAGGANLLSLALLALAGGLILNLMPCVLPILAMKAVGFVQVAANGRVSELRRHGIFYTIGVLLSFLAIAATFTGLRASGEFLSIGFQLQYPVGVALLALLMFAIGLWLLGVFELGTSLQGVGSGLAARGGAAGTFFTGVLAALVGAPCIGPFLGVAMGAVISEPAPIVFLVFGLVGLGLALPFLILSFMPGLQRLLPKPGAWMETLKQVFAFPMFLTAAWLLSVLGEQAGTGPIIWTVAGAIVIAFGAWMMSKTSGVSGPVARLLGVVVLVFGVFLPVRASLTSSPDKATPTAYAEAKAVEQWSTERVDELMDEGIGVFVDFTASWCVTCQLNKATTLQHADIQKAFADKNVVFMVADFTNQNDAIADELRKRGRPGVPMYLFYRPGNPEPKILPQILTKDIILTELEAI
ncbi:MAG: protein-disulfide reductase DsbD domain-containing protein [Pseudomonadota bacterium]